MSTFGMQDHTAHTLEHIRFRRKCEALRIVSEHAEVPGFENAFGRYRLSQRPTEIEPGNAQVAKLVGMDGFEKRVMIWRVSGTQPWGAQLIEAAMREAKQGASLSHANVAQVLDLGIVDGICFVATEHVSGRTLGEVLGTRQGLRWPVTAYIAREVAAALSYAHGRRAPSGALLRLVHGRLAPSHIALSSAGDVKVTGFGTSWVAPPLEEYRSPEDARGEPVDGRADVFALGAVLRKCLPQSGLPAALRDLMEWALQPYPECRPTAVELRRELIQILHAAARPVSPREIAELSAASPPSIGAIERLEQALDSMTLGPVTHARTMLRLYDRFGQLCVAAHVGARGATHMTRALDLADGLGHDDYAARFCSLRAELLAQANRTDESRDWLERAAAFRR